MQGKGKEAVHGGHEVIEHLLDTAEVERSIAPSLACLPALFLQLFGEHSVDELAL